MRSAVGTLLQVCEVADIANRDIAASLNSNADKLADEAVGRVSAAGMGILDQLTPRLVTLVERSSRQRLATWRIRSIIGTVAVALLALAVSGGYVYAIGYTSGRTSGGLIGRTISAAMAAGPEVAAD
jgi:hypothetical protein